MTDKSFAIAIESLIDLTAFPTPSKCNTHPSATAFAALARALRRRDARAYRSHTQRRVDGETARDDVLTKLLHLLQHLSDSGQLGYIALVAPSSETQMVGAIQELVEHVLHNLCFLNLPLLSQALLTDVLRAVGHHRSVLPTETVEHLVHFVLGRRDTSDASPLLLDEQLSAVLFCISRYRFHTLYQAIAACGTPRLAECGDACLDMDVDTANAVLSFLRVFPRALVEEEEEQQQQQQSTPPCANAARWRLLQQRAVRTLVRVLQAVKVEVVDASNPLTKIGGWYHPQCCGLREITARVTAIRNLLQSRVLPPSHAVVRSEEATRCTRGSVAKDDNTIQTTPGSFSEQPTQEATLKSQEEDGGTDVCAFVLQHSVRALLTSSALPAHSTSSLPLDLTCMMHLFSLRSLFIHSAGNGREHRSPHICHALGELLDALLAPAASSGGRRCPGMQLDPWSLVVLLSLIAAMQHSRVYVLSHDQYASFEGAMMRYASCVSPKQAIILLHHLVRMRIPCRDLAQVFLLRCFFQQREKGVGNAAPLPLLEVRHDVIRDLSRSTRDLSRLAHCISVLFPYQSSSGSGGLNRDDVRAHKDTTRTKNPAVSCEEGAIRSHTESSPERPIDYLVSAVLDALWDAVPPPNPAPVGSSTWQSRFPVDRLSTWQRKELYRCVDTLGVERVPSRWREWYTHTLPRNIHDGGERPAYGRAETRAAP